MRKSKSPSTEAWLHAVLYSIGDAVIATNARGRVMMMNPVAERLTDWKEPQARGRILRSVFRIINEQTRKPAEDPVARVLREGTVVGLANHTVLISRKGKEFPIADAGAPIKDENGKIVGVVVVFHDQTAERTARRIADEARELAESTIATIREPLLVLDSELEVVAANRSFYRLFQTSPRETIGKKIYLLGNRQWNIPKLRALLEDILPGNSHFDDFEVTHDFERIGKRTMLLNARRILREEPRSQLILLAIEDVTERKRAENALRLFRDLLDQSHDIIEVVDPPTGRFLDVNQQACLNSGYSREELLKMTIFDIDPTINRRQYRRQLANLRQTGALTHEGIHRRKDGTEYPVEVAIRYVSLDRDYIVTIVRNITERKKAQATLQESEERFRYITSVISDYAYAFRVNPDNSLVGEWVSESFTKVFGFTLAEVRARGGWQSMVHPEDLPGMLKHALKVVNGTSDIFETRLVARDGSIRLIRDYATPVWDEKERRIVRIYGAAQDITEQKKVEDQLRQILQYATNLFYTHTPDHVLTYVSPQAREFLGCEPEEAMVRWTEFATDHPINKLGFELTERAIQTGKPQPPYQLQLRKKSGEIIWVEVHEAPVVKNGVVTAIVGSLTDITERKRAEDALRESELHYRTVVTNAPVVLWAVNREGIFTFSEGKGLERLGLRPGEVVGKSVFDLYRDVPQIVENHRRALEGHTITSTVEVGGLSFESSYTPLRSPNGEVVGVIGISVDITELKQAERTLRESEERFRLLAESSLTGIYLIQDQQFAYVNQSLAGTFGYTVEEIIGKLGPLDLTHPDDRSRVLENIRRRVAGDVEAIRYEFKGIKKDGTVIFLEVHGRRIEYQRKVGIIGTLVDITKRKLAEKALRESEERYHSLFEESRDAIYISTPEGKFIDINPAGVELLGYASREELLGVHIARDLYWSPTKRGEFVRLMQRQGYVENFELELKRKDGRKIITLETATTMRDEAGNPIAYRGILRDITTQRALEEQLRQAQKLESLGTLASGIAHDFNNILGIIMGHATLLQHKITDPEKATKSLDAIVKASERGASLVKQMLTFSRKAEVHFEPLDLNILLKEMKKMLTETFPKTIDIQLDLDQTLPGIVADPTQMHQVVLNFCVNARDAMPHGGTLRIATKRTDARDLNRRFPNATARTHVELTVADTGIGMDERVRQRIFEPFFTTKPPGHGTGLGLSVVHGIVATHGGFIDVFSSPGKGTTFHVYLPALEQPIELEKREADQPLRGGNETILVIEDEELLRVMAASMLQSYGYTVLQAQHGEEGIQLYEQHQNTVSLVLTDIGLPKISGEEVYRKLKSSNPRLRIVLASGFLDPQIKAELLKDVRTRFVQKPYRPAEVLRTVRDLLDLQP